MKKFFNKIVLFFLAVIFCLPAFTKAAPARENITDWYIKDFQSEIVVNKDSTLTIAEKITADCGNLPNKHGIYRTLPLISRTPEKDFKTPIELISITDFEGNKLNYSVEKTSETINWKIGDANKTVQGINKYEIRYKVKNTTRSDDTDFDEVYWNLSGNLWRIDIDHFSARVNLPDEISKNNTKLFTYSGTMGAKGNEYSTFNWENDHTVFFESTKMLAPGYGITASLTFPKKIVTPYSPSFLDKYGLFLQLVIPPLFALILGFLIWKKFGRDPKIDKAITPEFDVPDNLAPAKTSTIFNNGRFDSKTFAASLINLAVNNKVTIKQLQEKTLFRSADYEFTLNPDSSYKPDAVEQTIIDNVLPSGIFKLSDLRKDYSFSMKLLSIAKLAKENSIEEGYFEKNGFRMAGFLLVFYLIFCFFTTAIFIKFLDYFEPLTFIGLFLGTAIIIVFLVLMPKRTQKGAELLWRIKGFKLYMETAEKYRQEFYEKENIFERFLPYAILFGITKEWIKKIEQLKGSQYFTTYHPVWFAGDFSSFDANSFASAIDSMASSIGTASGAGGAGSAGGGGGGGGGGGW